MMHHISKIFLNRNSTTSRYLNYSVKNGKKSNDFKFMINNLGSNINFSSFKQKYHSISYDTFGNTFIKFSESTENIQKLHNIIEEVKHPNKGIILINIDAKIIEQLNKKYYNNDIIFLAEQDNIAYNLLVNKSNCPQFCDSKIYASGVSFIIKYENSFYALLVKDKTKKILTCIGGTCLQSDYKTNKFYSVDTALRELNEETFGIININSKSINYNGLIPPNRDQLKPFCEIEFGSTYYGLKIQDFYKCYGFFENINSSKELFWKLLFDSSNKLPNGDFKMNYLDQNETEYIYAIKFRENINSVEKIRKQIKEINLENCRISTLHMFLNYFHFNKLQNNQLLNTNNLELFSKMDHPSFRSINLLPFDKNK